MLAQERYKVICEMLQKQRTAKVTQLSSVLNVSRETIRRDLEYLEKEGLLVRVHGGASLVRFDTAQASFDARLHEKYLQKEQIANTALQYISEGQSISLDYSTTSLALATKLKQHFQQLTVVTNSIEVFYTLSDVPSFNLIFCGGIFNHMERGCFGEQAHNVIRQLNIDTAFIGIGGISLRDGCTETFYEGVQMLKLFLQAAQQKIVLADSSKFDIVTLIKVCDLDNIDLIITDSLAKKKILEKYTGEIDIVFGNDPPLP
ncbi:DeoR/GlpR family DNA-binding transcription regulator [Christensenella intestinihominis]|uniref:DeoR/GlpR family DNA-binding transcription regulator n=1 Tax=Christensenella intestinihominis TaxID=1851429 RepID=UPI0008329F92|nr:DeoR/GlpR family DNA-binding transcription regulator [Christensenella intestinihominis]